MVPATAACRNCGTDRFPIKAGFCTRCSYCIRKIARLKKADPKTPSSLVRAIPKGGFDSVPPDPRILHGYGPGYWGKQFEKDRLRLIREFKSRLRYLRDIEQLVRGDRPISYLHIVAQFRHLARWCGCPRNKRILHGISADLESFTPTQKLLLYRWLNEISENTSRRWNLFHVSFQ